MVRIYLVFALVLLSFGGYAQTSNANKQSVPRHTQAAPDKDFIETMPVPPFNINEFLGEHVVYPDSAIDAHIEGRVLVQFVLTEKGEVTEAKVVRSVHPLLDSAAVDAIRMMPPWKPGVQNGKPVKVMYTQPITFKIPPAKK